MKQERWNPAFFTVTTGMLLFLFFPSAVAEGVRSGLTLCVRVLIPSLFPVSVLTGCMIRMGVARLFSQRFFPWLGRFVGLSGAGMLPFLLGLLGGFPLGAQMLAELYQNGSLNRREALRAQVLCNNAGPAFLIGAVGSGIFGQPELGAALLVIQLLSAWTAGLLLRGPAGVPPKASKPPAEKSVPFSKAFFAALDASAKAMLRLTATVSFFSAVMACIASVLPLGQLSPPVQAGVTGFLELSGGTALLSGMERGTAFVLSAAMTAWGGLCVHAQALQAFSPAGLPSGKYVVAKLLQAGLSAALALIVLSFDRVPLLCAGLLLLGVSAISVFLRISVKIHWKSKKPVV